MATDPATQRNGLQQSLRVPEIQPACPLDGPRRLRIGSTLLALGLLVVLWLFADLMVWRGRVPAVRELTPKQLDQMERFWEDLTRPERPHATARGAPGTPVRQGDRRGPSPRCLSRSWTTSRGSLIWEGFVWTDARRPACRAVGRRSRLRREPHPLGLPHRSRQPGHPQPRRPRVRGRPDLDAAELDRVVERVDVGRQGGRAAVPAELPPRAWGWSSSSSGWPGRC